jgi:hypothetical protein
MTEVLETPSSVLGPIITNGVQQTPVVSVPVSSNKIPFIDNIQSVMQTYHISVLHVGLVMFLICTYIFYITFEEQVKTFCRKMIREWLYRLQTNSDGSKVTTTSKKSTSKLVQFLTYLEHSWFASSSDEHTLPSNVHLDDEYQPYQQEEEEEEDNASESELFHSVRDV